MENDESPAVNENGRDFSREAKVLAEMLAALQELTPTGREHILNTVATFFGPSSPVVVASPRHSRPSTVSDVAAFSEDRSPSPKQFMLEKRPQTDVERVAALAYYLTHYRSQPHFKTLDISQLNTEAAQIKLSNPSKAMENAIRAGLISQASKGARQISGAGELYVQALPDRDAAREAFKLIRPKRRRRATSSSESTSETEGR